MASSEQTTVSADEQRDQEEVQNAEPSGRVTPVSTEPPATDASPRRVGDDLHIPIPDEEEATATRPRNLSAVWAREQLLTTEDSPEAAQPAEAVQSLQPPPRQTEEAGALQFELESLPPLPSSSSSDTSDQKEIKDENKPKSTGAKLKVKFPSGEDLVKEVEYDTDLGRSSDDSSSSAGSADIILISKHMEAPMHLIKLNHEECLELCRRITELSQRVSTTAPTLAKILRSYARKVTSSTSIWYEMAITSNRLSDIAVGIISQAKQILNQRNTSPESLQRNIRKLAHASSKITQTCDILQRDVQRSRVFIEKSNDDAGLKILVFTDQIQTTCKTLELMMTDYTYTDNDDHVDEEAEDTALNLEPEDHCRQNGAQTTVPTPETPRDGAPPELFPWNLLLRVEKSARFVLKVTFYVALVTFVVGLCVFMSKKTVPPEKTEKS